MMNKHSNPQVFAWFAVPLLLAVSQVARAGGGTPPSPTPIAAVTRSLADEKAETFLQRAYPRCRVILDPRFSTASGVFRAYFVALPDERFVRAELETQYRQVAPPKGKGTARAFLVLTEKPLRTPFTWKVVANAAGPVSLGMKSAAVSQACAEYPVRVERVTVKRNARPRPVLAITCFGKRLMHLETAGNAIARIEVLDARLTTPHGLGAGTSLSTLAQRYGTGELLQGPDGVSAIFSESCAGRAFKLDVPAPSLGMELSWATLLKRDPRAVSVLVAGSASAFAAATRTAGLPRARQSRSGEGVEAFLRRAYPGCATAYDSLRSRPREGYRCYLIRTPSGIVCRVELEPLPEGRRGVLTLTHTPVRQPFQWQVTERTLGPIRLGMRPAEVEGACEAYAVTLGRTAVLQEGERVPAIAVNSFGKPLAELVLGDRNTVEYIRVRDSRWKTPQTAGIGNSLRDLLRLYGSVQLLVSEGEVWVTFPRRCPGRSFRLSYPVPVEADEVAWTMLLKANPRVSAVRIGE